MRFTLITLGIGCIGFGALPGPIIRRFVAPAASTLTHPATYSSGVLTGHAPLPATTVDFAYLNPTDLATTAATLLLGLALAALYLRIPEPAPITLLRRLHTGSVNDYAAFATIGILACTSVLML
ncbi:MAG: hypothetical protein JO147_05875 [Actinobacteria bacterium]|nr:hypothetical protein [Actinomycetota bacterium]